MCVCLTRRTAAARFLVFALTRPSLSSLRVCVCVFLSAAKATGSCQKAHWLHYLIIYSNCIHICLQPVREINLQLAALRGTHSQSVSDLFPRNCNTRYSV